MISLLLSQLIGDGNNLENYERIIAAIGSAEVRMDRLNCVLECFDPVWPKFTECTTRMMQRIALSLLPEMS